MEGRCARFLRKISLGEDGSTSIKFLEGTEVNL